jgi:hypothetical protein
VGVREDDPADFIGEKVNRIVEELLGTARDRAGISLEPHSERSLVAVPPNE